MINGCDSFPEGLGPWNWKVCCDAHDLSYTVGGDWMYRIQVDFELGHCVFSILWPVGIVMCLGVLAAGWLFYRYNGLGGANLSEMLRKESMTEPSTRIVTYIGGKEGFVGQYYLDPVGIPTWGYGATWNSKTARDWWMAKYGRKIKKGDTISQSDALALLKLMIKIEYAPPVDRRIPNQPVHVREAATSFVLNAGEGATKWRWFQYLIKGDIKNAAAAWRVTATTARGKKLPGLVIRRREEADIAEFNRWPEWVGYGSTEAPATRIAAEDIKQAQLWLSALGYEPGPADGVPGDRTQNAMKRFQNDHGTLKADGIIGPATLSALQRTIDLRNKGGAATGTVVATSSAGVAENTTDVAAATPVGDFGWVGDLLLWGGLGLFAVFIVWLAWRYQDEINALVKRLA